MTTWVALFRGINVGKAKPVGMEDLAGVFRSLDFENIRTYLRSGNVVFDSTETDPYRLSALLEKQVTVRAGYPVKVLVRNAGELGDIVRNNPFVSGDDPDPGKLHVTFLSAIPSPDAVDKPGPGESGSDRFVIRGREVYLYCPDGYGRTKFSNTFFERHLNVIATTRNWRTVTALSAMANENYPDFRDV